MKTQYYILLSLKTPAGFEYFGQFELGNDKDAANTLFINLEGDPEPDGRAVLHIDQMETVDALPVKINTKCCTLDELASNIKIIARETFRLKNLRNLDE
ncbi:hypothetical protein FPZ43_00280 [Mucilaginibacter pallidiroseus]|uniref:Uncharacterized protein n=1 Tax=Mucilaginibacter pallidiroseus TaxID=2599295 RepID=A0A563UHW2_9SPHI|nr:hypothetical protein [Mucilaginibacter pallidiroseus]TWR30955.1 hypothetical protein FPZ43_00280 [Mucilaginibacter pallidiroseus]